MGGKTFLSNLARARLNGSKKLVVSCVYLVMLMMNDNVVKMYYLLLLVPAKKNRGEKAFKAMAFGKE